MPDFSSPSWMRTLTEWGQHHGTRLMPRLWGLLPIIFISLFFVIPFMIVFKISFSDIRIGLPPYSEITQWIAPKTWSLTLNLSHYHEVLFGGLYIRVFFKTLVIACTSTLICISVSYPMAYALSKTPHPWRLVGVLMVVIPFWTSFIIRVYAWVNLLSPQGVLNSWLIRHGWIQTPLSLIGHDTAVCFGIAYAYLPFMILPLYATLEKMNPALSEASADLGCTPWRTFWFVIFPLSRPGIMAGSLLVWISSVGEYVIPELLGGSSCLMMARVLWIEFFANRHWPIAASVSVIMILFLVVPMIIFQSKRLHQESDALS